MGFLDLFRPKWRHSDVEVRAEAVRELDDPALLSRVLADDGEARIRRIALKKISDLEILLRASEKDSDAGVREAAREKASERLLRSATSDDDDDALAALRRLTAERDLAQVVRTGQSVEARKTALERVSDERLLAEIARRAADNELRVAATKRIADPKLLEDLARGESHKGVALAATDKLSDGRALGLVARGAKSAAARTAAKAKLEARGEATEPAREITQQKKPPGTASAETKVKKALLLQITLAAESAARMSDLVAAERALADARARWNDVDPIPGTAPLATRLEKATAELGARRLADDRARELEAKRKEARRAREEADAKAQKAKLEEEQRAKEAAETAAAAPPPPVAAPEPVRTARVPAEEDEATRARREEQRLRREAERAGRIAALEKAIPELEALLAAEHDVKDLKQLDAALKDFGPIVRGNGRGDDHGEEKELRGKGLGLLDRLATRLSELHESERWRRWAKAPKPDELILEAEALAQVLGETEDKRRAPAVLRELATKWKHAAGNAPNPKTQPLWDRFSAAVKKSEELLGEHFTKLEGDRAENLQKKEALAAAAEELRESTAWRETSEKLKALQAEWKAIGPVPNDQADAVWKRFRAACDHFFEARKAVEKVGEEEREANLKKKEELVARAETLARSTQWKDTADELKRLQEDWEAIGPVPREQQNAVWKRFRGAFDKFFDARKAAFAELDKERSENLKEKLLLCEKVEALAAGLDDDPEGVLEQVKVLQAEWKKVGPAPRGDQDAVWARFRTACDVIYAGPKFEPLPPGDTSGTTGFVNRLPLEKIAAQLSGKDEGRSENDGTNDGEDEDGEDDAAEGRGQDEPNPPSA